ANFPALGKLTALRFIEWAGKNPGGVISLPTGRTPEHFIRWVTRILERWETKEIQALLESNGIDASHVPDMRSLHFVQIDEFYPMDAAQHNSFNYYVNEFYIKGFGLSPANALLIDSSSLGLPPGRTMNEVFPGLVVDLSLRVRQTRTDLEVLQRDVINRVDEFCMEYESAIQELGGIGFFLGGIGPDGHIAFNVRGSSVFSVTRLTGTNYETQAAAATDLGGIEVSRTRLVITIGLATITYNPHATAIIIAAGDAKARIVQMAVENRKGPQYPASVLQDLPNARFYLTHGAASLLVERRLEDFCNAQEVTPAMAEDVITALALEKQKELAKLGAADFTGDRFGQELLRKTGKLPAELSSWTRGRIAEKIDKGLAQVSHTTFLHTEPHHDDIMLGYLAYIYHLVRDPSNKHYFANLTSGFTSVSNNYFLSILLKLESSLESGALFALTESGYFDKNETIDRMEDVYLYLDGAAASSQEMKDRAEANRLLRNLVGFYRTHDLRTIRSRVDELIGYLRAQYPGAKDPQHIQLLKGMVREWEVELLWAYFGIESSSIFPLRLGFYTGDLFSQEPEVDRDVLPIAEVMRKVQPDVVSVAFDPEGSGPDTHYKALQAVSEALKIYEKEFSGKHIRVWGYRNIWYRYRIAEANLLAPVSLNSLSMLNTAFMNCFGSQSAASFPSYEYDGPFSQLAQRIQVEQYGMIKTCLGKGYFPKNDHPRLRSARGMIFLKEMELAEFYEMVRELKKLTEARP
ncbi:MAG TPA: glucosamine-6-phosphate deaminase, partial [Bacteroidota bacterium]|nr:glucosamine-6-phosphate deaminase [Bacteroidota bacterium]